jgi:TetR/AcrR family transcriptional regulator, transcriptional repressor for nem operon
MARPKAFDTDAALVQAMQLFWKQGYESTSLDDLVNALGVNRASLYATFGAKHDLFLAALDRYGEAAITQLVLVLSSTTEPRSTLETVLRFLALCESGEGPARGCLMTNTALELGGRGDAEVDARLAQNARRVIDALTKLIARGQAAGELRASADARAVACTVFATMQGMRVSGRLGATRAELDAVVDATLSLLSA